MLSPSKKKKQMTLFETICRNSAYCINRVSLKEKKESYKEDHSFNKEYWAFVEALAPSLLCPLSVIETHVGEEYDFNKHIIPLIKEKLIWIIPFKNCFPHS